MNHAIIVAAGKGKRMNLKTNKILLSLVNKPIISYSLEQFEKSPLVDDITIVANKDEIAQLKIITKNFKKIKKIVIGGEKRQDSVYNGLKSIKAKDDDIIIIHNGANPFIDQKIISNVIENANKHGAAVAVHRAKDTIKEVDEKGFVTKTLDREKLRHMQTPQAIRYDLAIKAFEKAKKDKHYATDDIALVERIGEKAKIVECDERNFKITTKDDFDLAESMLSGNVGLGQDSHRFADEDKPLKLGGIEIPNESGLEANSDGDVVLHSLFNALSQSIGERSIGYYCDAMPKKGITDSKEYLKIVLDSIREKGYKINNIGIMIEAKSPLIEPYVDEMRKSIANMCGIEPIQVGITATSGEELTEFGKGKGIQVFSIVSLKCSK